MKAFIMIRPQPEYRREVFAAGFKRLGYTPIFDSSFDRLGGNGGNSAPTSDNDVLVIWNRYGAGERAAKLFSKVVVAENGYIPMRGTKKTFALALDFHNGCGRYPTRDHTRRGMLDIDVFPWRKEPLDTLVLLPQRGIGNVGVAMPRNWPTDVLSRLPRKYRTYTRHHPGNRPGTPLHDDLNKGQAAVIWGSGAGIKAICAGIPVFHELPQWIGREGAKFGVSDLTPVYPDRTAMLETIAWAIWTAEEVTSGEPFKRLLEIDS